MLRVVRTLLASFVFLSVTTLVGYFAAYLPITKFWIVFGIGAGVFVLGILLGIADNAFTTSLSFFVNAVAMGFWLRAWYINRGFDNSLLTMFTVTVFATLYLLIFALPLFLPVINRHYGLYLVLFVLLSLGGYIALLILTETTWVSTLGYFGIVQLGFVTGMSFECEDWDDERRALLMASFSVVACGIIILVTAISSGDCDCSCDGATAGNLAPPISGKRNNLKTDVPPLVFGDTDTAATFTDDDADD